MWDWATKGDWTEEPSTDTEWKWKLNEEGLHIAFRGSTSRLDWKQNLTFWVKPYKQMPVPWFAHKGFVDKWKSVEERVLELVSGADVSRVRLYGFSQGGAVATLAHEAIRFHFPEIFVTSRVWGSPRVLWGWNLKKIKDRFYGFDRWSGSRDIVPHLPPWVLGYRHVGKEHREKSNYPIYQLQKNHEDYQC